MVKLIKGDRTSIEKRLAKLWRAYYLERIFLPIWPGRPKPSLKAIYALDKKGAEMLTDVQGINPTHLRHQIRNRQTGERYLKHYLMISNFRTILTLATEERRNLELLFFRHDKSLEDRVRIEDETYPVAPDAYIGLKDKEGKFYFFLEADRSTMSDRRFLKKTRGYFLWWKEKGHINKFEIKHFRVLTLTKSEERAETLRKVTLKVKGDENQEGSTLFWFSDESRISLEDPKTIFRKIWRKAAKEDAKLHSILE